MAVESITGSVQARSSQTADPSLDVTSVQNLEGGFLDLFTYEQNRWSGWGVAQW